MSCGCGEHTNARSVATDSTEADHDEQDVCEACERAAEQGQRVVGYGPPGKCPNCGKAMPSPAPLPDAGESRMDALAALDRRERPGADVAPPAPEATGECDHSTALTPPDCPTCRPHPPEAPGEEESERVEDVWVAVIDAAMKAWDKPMPYNDSPIELIAKIIDERDEAREQRDRLLGQLPVGMKHCSIVFRQCPVGHGWLTATNWADFPCPTCAFKDGQAAIERLRSDLAAANARAEALSTLRAATVKIVTEALDGAPVVSAVTDLDTQSAREKAARLYARAEEAERRALMAGQDKVAAQRRADSSHRLMENERAARLKAERERDEAKAPRWLCEGCGWIGASIQGGGHFRAPDDHCGPCVPLDEGARRLAERLPLAEREREELRAAWIAVAATERAARLLSPRPARARPGPFVYCPECDSRKVAIDSDGCCATCGTEALVTDVVARLRNDHQRLAAAEAEVKRLTTLAPPHTVALRLNDINAAFDGPIPTEWPRDVTGSVVSRIAALRARAQRLVEAGDALRSLPSPPERAARWDAAKADAPAKEGKP